MQLAENYFDTKKKIIIIPWVIKKKSISYYYNFIFSGEKLYKLSKQCHGLCMFYSFTALRLCLVFSSCASLYFLSSKSGNNGGYHYESV